MTDIEYPQTIHIKWVETHEASITWVYCPDCEKRRACTRFYEEWYGNTFTCLGCGLSCVEGEPRNPTLGTGWREEAIAIAKDRYRTYKNLPQKSAKTPRNFGYDHTRQKLKVGDRIKTRVRACQGQKFGTIVRFGYWEYAPSVWVAIDGGRVTHYTQKKVYKQDG